MPDKNLEDLIEAAPEVNQGVEDERQRQAAQDAASPSLDWTDAGDVLEVAGDILSGAAEAAVDVAKDAAGGAAEVVASIVGGMLDS